MFCVYCGAKLKDEFAFCYKCGKPKVDVSTINDETTVEYEIADEEEIVDEDETADEDETDVDDMIVFCYDDETTDDDEIAAEENCDIKATPVINDDTDNGEINKLSEDKNGNKVNNFSNNIVTIDGCTFKYEERTQGIYIMEFIGDSEEVRLPETINDKKVVGFSIMILYRYIYDNEREAERNKRHRLFIPECITEIEDLWYAPGMLRPSFYEISVAENNPAFCSIDGVLYNKEKTKLLNIPLLMDRTVDLPDTVCEISFEDMAFIATEFSAGKNNSNFYSKDGLLYTKDKTKLLHCSRSKIGSVSVAQSVSVIGRYAFYGCKISEIILRKGVTIIEDNAISCCNNLTKIKLPSGLVSIGDYAFAFCKYLMKISVPTTLYEIGSSAFADCGYLEDICLPMSIRKINDGAFRGCTKLTEIKIPLLINEISPCMFESCSNLAKISFSGSIEKIGEYSFYDCTSLTEFVVPEGVTVIGKGAFSGCTNLKEITLPEGITKLGNESDCTGVFGQCESLKSITIPSSVKTIGANAFTGCTSLKEIEIPDGVEHIENNTFFGCKEMLSVSLPDSITSVGSCVFSGCEKLKKIKLPKNVKNVAQNAFDNCSGLNELQFPAGAKVVGGFFSPETGIEVIKKLFSSINLSEVTLSDEMMSYLSDVEFRSMLPHHISPAADSKIYSVYYFIYSKSDGSDRSDTLYYICSDTLNRVDSTITIPDYITKVSDFAFSNYYLLNKNLKIAVTEKLLPRIRKIAENITGLSVILYENYYQYEIIDSSDGKKEVNLIKYTGNAEKVTIPSAICGKPVTVIKSGCFNAEDHGSFCIEFILPECVKTVESRAFCGYNRLTKFTVTGQKTDLQNNSIVDCPKLNSVITPNGKLFIPFLGWKNSLPQANMRMFLGGNDSVVISTHFSDAILRNSGHYHKCIVDNIGKEVCVETYDHLMGESCKGKTLSIVPRIDTDISDLQHVNAIAYGQCIFLADNNNVYQSNRTGFPIFSGINVYQKIYRMMVYGNILFIVSLYVDDGRSEEFSLMGGDYGGIACYKSIKPELSAYDLNTHEKLFAVKTNSPVCSVLLNLNKDGNPRLDKIRFMTDEHNIYEMTIDESGYAKMPSLVESLAKLYKNSESYESMLSSTAQKNEEIVWFTKKIYTVAPGRLGNLPI